VLEEKDNFSIALSFVVAFSSQRIDMSFANEETIHG